MTKVFEASSESRGGCLKLPKFLSQDSPQSCHRTAPVELYLVCFSLHSPGGGGLMMRLVSKSVLVYTHRKIHSPKQSEDFPLSKPHPCCSSFKSQFPKRSYEGKN